MMGFLLAIQGAVSQGVLWGIMTLGVYLTFRILDIADLTVDGSFATGGALSAILIVNGTHPLISLLCSFIAGAVCGLVTGLMNTKLKIHILLASILTQIALYSVNIRIMGRSNIPLLGVRTIMTGIHEKFALSITASSLVVGALFVVVLVVALYLFFGTEIGCSLRATGNNEYMVRALGVNTNTMKVAGLALGNGLVALSGGLVAQSQGYADVQMGTGTIVIGLASIIIGEVIFGKHFGFWYTLISVILGSILYRIVIALVLQMGLRSTDLKLLTALVVAIALAVPVFKGKLFRRRHSLPARLEESTRHSNVIKKHAVPNTETLGENKNC
ncbi:MAG: ABC transporter permease [Treponema sp.]|nr:ABC transporter permease [Treponema sp.]